MRLTDSQFGALHTLLEFGPKEAEEILLPPAMDGSRKTKLVCHFMTAPMLQRMEVPGYFRERCLSFRLLAALSDKDQVNPMTTTEFKFGR